METFLIRALQLILSLSLLVIKVVVYLYILRRKRTVVTKEDIFSSHVCLRFA